MKLNKLEYQQLLKMRKSEEELFFQLIKYSGKTPRELINSLPINHKRAWYLLEKWSGQDRYDYGTTLDLGWVYDKEETK